MSHCITVSRREIGGTHIVSILRFILVIQNLFAAKIQHLRSELSTCILPNIHYLRYLEQKK